MEGKERQKNHIPKDMVFFVKLIKRKLLKFNRFVTAFVFEVQDQGDVAN